jgi:hypothetical protein
MQTSIHCRLPLPTVNDLALKTILYATAAQRVGLPNSRTRKNLRMAQRLSVGGHILPPLARHRKVDLWSFDIESAYKIFAVSATSKSESWIRLWTETLLTQAGPAVVRSLTLVFGHVLAVYNFNVASSLLKTLLVVSFDLADSIDNYFDDYFGFAPNNMGQTYCQILGEAAALVGLKPKEGKNEFGKSINLLGLIISVEQLQDKNGHTNSTRILTCLQEEKMTRLVSKLESLLVKNSISMIKEVQTLVGKLGFWASSSSTLIKQIGFTLLSPIFRKFSTRNAWVKQLSQDEETCALRTLTVMKDFLLKNSTRVYDPAEWSHKPIYLWTDASIEGDNASMAGIFSQYDPINKVMCSKGWQKDFSVSDNPEMFRHASSPIAWLEQLAIEHSIQKYKTDIKGKLLFLFTDNSVAFYAMTKGRSRAPLVHTSAVRSLLTAASVECEPWTEWVPSDWNISDILTRLPSQGEERQQILQILQEQFGLHEIDFDDTIECHVILDQGKNNLTSDLPSEDNNHVRCENSLTSISLSEDNNNKAQAQLFVSAIAPEDFVTEPEDSVSQQEFANQIYLDELERLEEWGSTEPTKSVRGKRKRSGESIYENGLQSEAVVCQISRAESIDEWWIQCSRRPDLQV